MKIIPAAVKVLILVIVVVAFSGCTNESSSHPDSPTPEVTTIPTEDNSDLWYVSVLNATSGKYERVMMTDAEHTKYREAVPTLAADAPMWNGNFATINQFYYYDCNRTIDTTTLQKLDGVSAMCPDGSQVPYLLRPGVRPYNPSAIQKPTALPLGDPVMKDEPIIGSFIFEKSQFKYDESYYSGLGMSEYDFRVVPLDHSPDIKWTFRDDGAVLFSNNNNGELLRTGTWTKSESDGSKVKYQIKRGNHYYTGVYDNNGFRITQPGDWRMIKIN